MNDLDAEVEWEQTVTLTPKQISRLNEMKEKSVWIRRARHQQRMFKEELARKQEEERDRAEFKSWIWGAMDTHMESSKEVTLVDTPDIQVQASLDIMALANSIDNNFQESGMFS